MSAKRLLAVTLVTLLAAPPPQATASPSATLTGVALSTTGSRLANLDLQLVNLDSGQVSVVQTDGVGSFKARLEPGLYGVDVQKGYTVLRGPRVVRLASGEDLSTEFLVVNLDPQESGGGEGSKPAGAGDPNVANIVAVALFSAALVGIVIRSATVKPKPKPPSPSR